ncbi:uncharacterized protein LOC129674114 [Psammomys obesus]|uniref:uncharacterized protein LOC129674114 n=1 Tax=Psammomys obesus TaxID=48139 RepID=UPI002452811B|nr:uncharacterized protein LOC129674114 [Psammomys obesus]
MDPGEAPAEAAPGRVQTRVHTRATLGVRERLLPRGLDPKGPARGAADAAEQHGGRGSGLARAAPGPLAPPALAVGAPGHRVLAARRLPGRGVTRPRATGTRVGTPECASDNARACKRRHQACKRRHQVCDAPSCKRRCPGVHGTGPRVQATSSVQATRSRVQATPPSVQATSSVQATRPTASDTTERASKTPARVQEATPECANDTPTCKPIRGTRTSERASVVPPGPGWVH